MFFAMRVWSMSLLLLLCVVCGADARPIIYGYYPHWARTPFPPEKLDLSPLTHVSHAGVHFTTDGTLQIPPGMTQRHDVATLRGENARRVILAIGAVGDKSVPFAQALQNTSAFTRVVTSLVDYVRTQGYDGVEVNWEYPRTPEDRRALTHLLRALHTQMPKKTYVITVHASHFSGAGIDVEDVLPFVNYIVLMGYDYAGAWSERSGHNAPMHAQHEKADITTGVAHWRELGIPHAKMVLAMPLYGRRFSAAGVGRTFTKSGSVTYRDIRDLQRAGWSSHWDYDAQVPFLLNPKRDAYISYDDPRSLGIKIQFAARRGMAGVAMWQVTGDFHNGRHALLPYIGVTARRAWGAE